MQNEQPAWLAAYVEQCRSHNATEDDWRQLLAYLWPEILRLAHMQVRRHYRMYKAWENHYEVATDALYILYTRIHSIQQPDKIVHWIAVVIKRLLARRYRRQWREHAIDTLPDAPCMCRNSANAIVTQLKLEIPKLSWDQRRTLFLWYWLDTPPDECARILGVSRATVYNNLHRAHTHLRHALLNAGFTGSE